MVREFVDALYCLMSNLTSIASLASGHLLYWAFIRHLDGFRSSGMLWLRLAVLILLFTSLRRFMYCVGSAGWSLLKLGLGISCFTFLDTICCVATGRLYISSDPPATLNPNIGGDKMGARIWEAILLMKKSWVLPCFCRIVLVCRLLAL